MNFKLIVSYLLSETGKVSLLIKLYSTYNILAYVLRASNYIII